MNAPVKPRVEPLSRPAWERIEAGVFERLDRGEHLLPASRAGASRRKLWIWPSIAALAAAAAVALWSQWPAAEPGVVQAPATVEPASGAPARPVANPGTHIVTTTAPTRTTIGEAALTLAAESEVHVVGSDAEGWQVRLDHGELDCEVAPRNGRPPFVVQAGETRVTVVGTRFTVIRDGSTAQVSVREGRVQVASGPHQLSLGPGERWPLEPAAPELEEADDLEEPPAKSRTGKRSSAVSAQFARAARLEAASPDRALAIYRKLARGQGRWAANALYAEARLELERGHDERARQLLRRYLARHPSGPNGSDVRSLLERLGSSSPKP
jgi:hypothetical protein